MRRARRGVADSRCPPARSNEAAGAHDPRFRGCGRTLDCLVRRRYRCQCDSLLDDRLGDTASSFAVGGTAHERVHWSHLLSRQRAHSDRSWLTRVAPRSDLRRNADAAQCRRSRAEPPNGPQCLAGTAPPSDRGAQSAPTQNVIAAATMPKRAGEGPRSAAPPVRTVIAAPSQTARCLTVQPTR